MGSTTCLRTGAYTRCHNLACIYAQRVYKKQYTMPSYSLAAISGLINRVTRETAKTAECVAGRYLPSWPHRCSASFCAGVKWVCMYCAATSLIPARRCVLTFIAYQTDAHTVHQHRTVGFTYSVMYSTITLSANQGHFVMLYDTYNQQAVPAPPSDLSAGRCGCRVPGAHRKTFRSTAAQQRVG